MSTPADDLRKQMKRIISEMDVYKTNNIVYQKVGPVLDDLMQLTTAYADARVLEALEAFRVFSYEHEALQAWDTPASNRQGWLDTKLREFAELRQQQAKGKS